MKRWALLVVVLGSLEEAAGQKAPEADVPFRRANTVLLYTPAASADVLRALAENLRQRGFALDSADYERGLVTTKPSIPPGTESWPLAVRMSKMPGGVMLTGRVTISTIVGPTDYPSEFWGFDWSPAKKTFREVEATARAYDGGQVRFSRRPATGPTWSK